MKIKAAITSLKVEKGCVNMSCKYCTEKGKCNLETILEELPHHTESEVEE